MNDKAKTLCINIPLKKKAKPVASAKTPVVVQPAEAQAEALVGEEILGAFYDGILCATPEGKVTGASERASELFGYSKGELGRLKLQDLVDGADAGTMASILEGLNQRKHVLIDAYCLMKDSLLFPAEIVAAKQQPGRLVFFIRNISRRKLVEEELRNSEARNRALLEAIPDLILRLHRDGTVLDLKAPAGAGVLVPPPNATGRKLGEVFPDLAAELGRYVETTLQEKESRLFECRVAPDRNVQYLECRVVATGEDEVLMIVRDMSRRKQMEALALFSQKMEAIGQMAAGVAHEINSPVQYIGDNIRFLRDSFHTLTDLVRRYRELASAAGKGTDVRDLCDKMTEREKVCDIEYLCGETPKAIEQTLAGIERVTNLVAAMKSFSHHGQGRQEWTNLNKGIEATITISRHEWKYVAEVGTDLDSHLPLVFCVPDQINQVVLNTIVNAADAIREAIDSKLIAKGKITVTTRWKGENVSVIVSDNGMGIPPAVLHRIYDPFFTTKSVGKGTGQGLTIAHDIIVNKHHGTIDVQSAERKGSTFTITLPVGRA
ncbi:MAG: ATP-binding protein [Verrucomicrobiae bacterium]|nr:ATP-binding protein [Verrucomicrobiae bacterium]